MIPAISLKLLALRERALRLPFTLPLLVHLNPGGGRLLRPGCRCKPGKARFRLDNGRLFGSALPGNAVPVARSLANNCFGGAHEFVESRVGNTVALKTDQ